MNDFANLEDFKEKCGYTIEDDWYPRVTKIVGIKAKPALYHFYAEAKSVAAGQAISELSAKEGTLIHETAEAFLLGQKPEISEEIRPAIGSFLRLLEQSPIEVLSPEWVEARVVSRDHRYAGTVDAVVKIGGKTGVLDIKTSRSIYRDYNLQTAAYMDALKNELPAQATRWILRIDQSQMCVHCGSKRRVKGGREKITRNGRQSCPPAGHIWSETKGDMQLQEFPDWTPDFEAFLGAKRLWEWENDYWLRRIGYSQ